MQKSAPGGRNGFLWPVAVMVVLRSCVIDMQIKPMPCLILMYSNFSNTINGHTANKQNPIYTNNKQNPNVISKSLY